MTVADQIYEKLKRADPEVARAVLDFLEFLESRNANRASAAKAGSWVGTFGTLKGSANFDVDPVTTQRKLRDEWS